MRRQRGARKTKDAAVVEGRMDLAPIKPHLSKTPWRAVVITVGILAAAGAAYAMYAYIYPTESFESSFVTRGDLKRTISVTGEVKPVARINLSFQRGGSIESIAVRAGERVKAGDVLAELRDADVQFAYRKAQSQLLAASANLQLALAGERKEAVDVARKNVAKAQTELEASRTDLEIIRQRTSIDIASAEQKLEQARHELVSESLVLDAGITDAYDTLRVALLSSIGAMTTALSDGDQIIGVDDTATNQSYKHLLGVWSGGSMDQARLSYTLAKTSKQRAESSVNALGVSGARSQIDDTGLLVEQALLLIQTYLHDVQRVLAYSIPGTGFTSADLANAKTRIQTDLSSVSGELSAILTAKQAKDRAVLKKSQSVLALEDAVDAATISLQSTRTQSITSIQSAESVIETRKAAVSSAEADLALKESPPRDVELAPLRAAVAQAEASLEQAKEDLQKIRIIAPVNGTITDVPPEIGELVRENETAIRMIGEEAFDVEALIPEADIAIAKTGQTAVLTLDAYGEGTRFGGTVLSIDPDQTLLRDAVYYKAILSLAEKEHDVRPGMTANVRMTGTVATQSLLVPSAFIQTEGDATTVMVRAPNGQIRNAPVVILARGDGGIAAIQGGVAEGDVVLKRR
ncbi:HlyD family efflux transporter periplasmic adaptor subunit [Patescibacteria group bacterium]|uniref:HlyD family efflux transporter periplasmic adaptor subunit n=1 Tax=candidate division WWE3 bacterium TaxID=2053526 RepID=A0A928TWJ2_UNCKA|nr:HlyD family efflux transporter periplasmic adaptor subunit [candidate division WWE3 bacterium]MCL4732293.1 HlyD family efflux transporter periplasmic adaptor subunit [Patescibacteria group bacterium]MDL1953192.1 HlyD family efflux transporter periplasmic adaptor subunit [Candidatus Uhrbacteria bacterium UHB]RIL00353.1 MAG: hypothetical protein DCC77_02180 [Candidatus Uhrbacteria bacterium]